MDVLPDGGYEVFNLTVPKGTSRHNVPGGPVCAHNVRAACQLPTNSGRSASSTKGRRCRVRSSEIRPVPTRNAFLERVGTGKIATGQLTATKLERLMDRYAGKEWLPSRLKHLDFPESERADVVRRPADLRRGEPGERREILGALLPASTGQAGAGCGCREGPGGGKDAAIAGSDKVPPCEGELEPGCHVGVSPDAAGIALDYDSTVLTTHRTAPTASGEHGDDRCRKLPLRTCQG